MRSGDIMKENEGKGHYSQPPCAYYELVISKGNGGRPFDRVLVLTEEDQKNPCIAYVQKKFPTRTHVQSGSLLQDACTIISASNVALAFGTFASTLSRLNPGLLNLYAPFAHPRDRKKQRKEICTENRTHTNHLYAFPDYNRSWTSFNDRVKK